MSNIARFAFRLLIGLPFCAQGLYTLFVWRAREDAILNAWTNWLNYQGIWSNYPNLSEWFFYFVPFMTLAMFALEAFGGALMILRRQSHWAIWMWTLQSLKTLP